MLNAVWLLFWFCSDFFSVITHKSQLASSGKMAPVCHPQPRWLMSELFGFCSGTNTHTPSNYKMHEHIKSLLQIQSGVCLSPVGCVFFVFVCVHVCVPCPPTESQGSQPENLKGFFQSMCFNLALSSVITRKLWSHHRLHTHVHSPAYTSDKYTCTSIYTIITHTNTQMNVHKPLHASAHIPLSWGITLQSQPLFLQGKTCFIISFHFFLLCPHPLPAFSLSNMQPSPDSCTEITGHIPCSDSSPALLAV